MNAVRRRGSQRERGLVIERLLPLACLGGALVLILSEFMTTFRFEAAGEQVLDLSDGSERHAWAMLVLGVFAIAALVIAVRNGSKPAAIAVAAAGVTALLLFLIVDLPDAGQVGTFDDADQTFIQAETKPEEGFWAELIGALVLAVCGAALATLSGDQLRALGGRFSASARPSRSRRPSPDGPSGTPGASEDGAKPSSGTDEKGGRRKPSLARTQGERRRERT